METTCFEFIYCVSLDDEEHCRNDLREQMEQIEDNELSWCEYLEYADPPEFWSWVDSQAIQGDAGQGVGLLLLDVDFGFGKERKGLEVLRRMCDELPDWAVILVTGHDDRDILQSAQNFPNFAGYVCKPGVSRNAILNQLHQWRRSTDISSISESMHIFKDEVVALQKKLRELQDKQLPGDATPRQMLNFYNIRQYKPDLIDKAGWSMNQIQQMCMDIEFFKQNLRGTPGMNLRKFPINSEGFQVWEARMSRELRYYFKLFGDVVALMEVTAPGNKMNKQKTFEVTLRKNPGSYEAFFNQIQGL